MTETIDIYRNYGCLSAEKSVIYTYVAEQPTAVTSDRLTVTLPQGWTADRGPAGDVVLTAPDGQRYLPDEVLAGDERPMFEVRDRSGSRKRYMLETAAA